MAKENNQEKAPVVELTKEDRLNNLVKKNEEKMMVETKTGKVIPDFKLMDFQKRFEPELEEVKKDYKDIKSVIYKNEVKDGEMPLIDEAKDYMMETYLGLKPIKEDDDGREKALYFKGVKAFFIALRQGEIEEIKKEIKIEG